MSDALRSVVVDGLSVQTTDQGAQAIDKLLKDREADRKAIADANTAHTSAIAAKDEEIGALKADLQKARDAAPKPADLDKLVADRAALVTTVKAIDSKIVVDGKTDGELRRAAVAFKLGDEFCKDASDAEIGGMFKAIAKDVKPSDPVRDVLRAGIQTSDGSAAVAQSHSAYVNRLTDAWKGETKGAA